MDYASMIDSLKSPFQTIKYGYNYARWWFNNKNDVPLSYTIKLFLSLSFPYIIILIHRNIRYRYLIIALFQYVKILLCLCFQFCLCRSKEDLKKVVHNISFDRANEYVLSAINVTKNSKLKTNLLLDNIRLNKKLGLMKKKKDDNRKEDSSTENIINKKDKNDL